MKIVLLILLLNVQQGTWEQIHPPAVFPEMENCNEYYNEWRSNIRVNPGYELYADCVIVNKEWS